MQSESWLFGPAEPFLFAVYEVKRPQKETPILRASICLDDDSLEIAAAVDVD
jgi:hypothetical protein